MLILNIIFSFWGAITISSIIYLIILDVKSISREGEERWIEKEL